MKIYLRFTLIILFFIYYELPGQDYELDQITVTANRIPATFSESSRNVIVINQKQLENAPVQSLQDLFNYISGIDSKKRGPSGVQTDIAIRGGTFEQTLIMIDGVKISDPQTAHHNMNLPVNIDDIERIEIVKGQGSKSFGPNAFSGIINFITQKGKTKRISLSGAGGQNGYYNGELSVSYPYKNLGSRISLSKSKSDGYRYNTNFENTTLSFGTSLELGTHTLSFSAGINQKEFGANNFYSDKFPGQWEETKVLFLNMGSEIKLNNFTVSPKLYLRKHNDEYLLDLNRPAFYRNLHETNSQGAELQFQFSSLLGKTAFGGEISKDKIESSNLGNHQRTKGGVFAEQAITPMQDLKAVFGFFAYKYDKWGWKLWPGIDLGYSISNKVRLFASAGKSFRIPSFTELFYSSPAQKGNELLQPEEAVSYEIGVNYLSGYMQANISAFKREGRNVIDWVKSADSDPWSARNIASITTNGIETGVTLFSSIGQIGIDYTYLDINKNTDEYRSLYILDHLKHQLVTTITYSIFGVTQNWAVRYEDRINADDHIITDTKLMYNIEKFDLYIEATNLFNTPYYDIVSIPLPGRWIIGGVKFILSEPGFILSEP